MILKIGFVVPARASWGCWMEDPTATSVGLSVSSQIWAISAKGEGREDWLAGVLVPAFSSRAQLSMQDWKVGGRMGLVLCLLHWQYRSSPSRCMLQLENWQCPPSQHDDLSQHYDPYRELVLQLGRHCPAFPSRVLLSLLNWKVGKRMGQVLWMIY